MHRLLLILLLLLLWRLHGGRRHGWQLALQKDNVLLLHLLPKLPWRLKTRLTHLVRALIPLHGGHEPSNHRRSGRVIARPRHGHVGVTIGLHATLVLLRRSGCRDPRSVPRHHDYLLILDIRRPWPT